MADQSDSRSKRRHRVKALILTNLKHFSVTFLLLFAALVCFGIYIGADAHYFEDPLAYHLDGETHVFFEQDTLVLKTLRGNRDVGFSVDTRTLGEDDAEFEVNFPADGSLFTVSLSPDIHVPRTTYETAQPIIAVSDIESSFGAFRQFLVTHAVADEDLNWTFGQGHLVLVGDFVDRGASTTQVLWAIYKLEQSARQAGGQVHYIIGNHEIKSMQGNFQSAEDKYFYIAGMLGKQQHELFGDCSVLGRWMASKNVLEVINGVAFVHGGLHPDLAQYELTVDQINQTIRSAYRQLYFTPPSVTQTSFLRSSTTGPAWYRGYFKDDLTQEQVEAPLQALGAESVVVGHTLQSKVKALFKNRVFAIDVKHPKDYLSSFPPRRTEGLLIESGTFFRLKENGERVAL